MRVLHVTRGRGLAAQTGAGGLERALEGLVAAQRGVGLDVETIEVPAEFLEAVSGHVLVGAWDQVAEHGERLLGGRTCDVMHCHDWYAAPLLEAFARRGSRAGVVSSHLPLRRGFTYRDSSVAWEAKALLEARVFDLAAIIVVPSRLMATFLRQEYGVSQDRVVLIGHGVDAFQFSMLDEYLPQLDKHELLAVGRLTEQKGFELAVRALPFLLADWPTLHLTIVGDGERRDVIHRLIGNLGVSRWVDVRPAVSTETLAGLYRRAALLLMPSLFEPFGLVALEALASGCPVLASATVGVSDILEPEELERSPSPRQLAAAISRRLAAVTTPDYDRARLRARSLNHSWCNAADALSALYTNVILRKAAR